MNAIEAMEKAHEEMRKALGITGFCRQALPNMLDAALQSMQGEALHKILADKDEMEVIEILRDEALREDQRIEVDRDECGMPHTIESTAGFTVRLMNALLSAPQSGKGE